MGDYDRYINRYRVPESRRPVRSTISSGDISAALERYAPDSSQYLDEGAGSSPWKQGVGYLFKALNVGGAAGYAGARQLFENVGLIDDDGRGFKETYGAGLNGEGFTDLLYEEHNIDSGSNWFARAGLSALGFAADVIADPTTYLSFGTMAIGKQAVGIIARKASADIVGELSSEVVESAARKRIRRDLLIDDIDELDSKSLLERANEQIRATAEQAGKDADDQLTRELTFASEEDLFRTFAEREFESVIGTARIAGGGRQVAQSIDTAVKNFGGDTEMVLKGFKQFDKRLDKELLGGVRFAGMRVTRAGQRAVNNPNAVMDALSNNVAAKRLKLRAKAAPTMARFRGTWGEQYADVIQGIERNVDSKTLASDLVKEADVDWVRSMRVLDQAAADRALYVRTMKDLLEQPVKNLVKARNEATVKGLSDDVISVAMDAASRTSTVGEAVNMFDNIVSSSDVAIAVTKEQRKAAVDVMSAFRAYKDRLPKVLEEAGVDPADIKAGWENRVLTADAIAFKRGQGDRFGQSSALESRTAFKKSSSETEEMTGIETAALDELLAGVDNVGQMSVRQINLEMRAKYDIDFDYFVADQQQALDAVLSRLIGTVGHAKSFERLMKEGVLIASPEASKKLSKEMQTKLVELLEELALSADFAPPADLLIALMKTAIETSDEATGRLKSLVAMGQKTKEEFNARTSEVIREKREIWSDPAFREGFEADVDRIAALLSDESAGVKADDIIQAIEDLAGKPMQGEAKDAAEAWAAKVSGPGRWADDLDYNNKLNPDLKDANGDDITPMEFFEPEDYERALLTSGAERVEAAHNLMGQLVRTTMEQLEITKVALTRSQLGQDVAAKAIKEGRSASAEEVVFDPTNLQQFAEYLVSVLSRNQKDSDLIKLVNTFKSARTLRDIEDASKQVKIFYEQRMRMKAVREAENAYVLANDFKPSSYEGETLAEIRERAANGEYVGDALPLEVQRQIDLSIPPLSDEVADEVSVLEVLDEGDQVERWARRNKRLGLSNDEGLQDTVTSFNETNALIEEFQEGVGELQRIFRNQEKLRALQTQRIRPIDFTAQEGVALPGYLRNSERAIWFGSEGITDGMKNLYRAANDPKQSALGDYSDALLTLFKTYATVGQVGVGFHVRNALGAISNNIAAGVGPDSARNGIRLGMIATDVTQAARDNAADLGIKTVGDFRNYVRNETNKRWAEKHGKESIDKFYKLYGQSPGQAAVGAWDANVFQSRTKDALEERGNRALAVGADKKVDKDKIIVDDYEKRYLMNPSQENLEMYRFKSKQVDGKYVNITRSERMKQRSRYSKAVNNPVIDLSSKVGQKVEHSVRFGAFLEGTLRFGGNDGGAMMARSIHFDYQDLSDFERRIAKRVLPFYVWTRNNLPLQARLFLNRPGGFANLVELQAAMAQAMASPFIDNEAIPEWAKPKLGFYGNVGDEAGNFLFRMESPKLDLFTWIAQDNPLQGLADVVEGANPVLKLTADVSGTLGGPTMGMSYAKPISEGGDGSAVGRSALNLIGLRPAVERIGSLGEVFGDAVGVGEVETQDWARLLGSIGAPVSYAKNESINYTLNNIDRKRRELMREQIAREQGVDPSLIDARAMRLDAYRTGRYLEVSKTSDADRPDGLTDQEWRNEKRRRDMLRKYGFID